jgi:hypothetical protein
MPWDNNGISMEFQRQSRTICGRLTLLIFKVMEVQTILDVLLQIQDGGNFSDTEAKQL